MCVCLCVFVCRLHMCRWPAMHVKMKFVYFTRGVTTGRIEWPKQRRRFSNRLIYIAFSLLNYYSSLMVLLICDFGGRAVGQLTPRESQLYQ